MAVDRFSAFRIHPQGAGLETLALDELTPGEVVVRVHWSGINYKDALAGTGKGRILRRFPLVGGVDLAGVVVESADPATAVGEKVLVTGCGLSETRDGGYAGYARVPREAVVKLTPSLTPRLATDSYSVRLNSVTGELLVTYFDNTTFAPGATVYRYAIPAPGALPSLALAGALAARRRRRA